MWKAYSVFSDFNPSMCELLRKYHVMVTCSSGNRPNEQELIDLFYHYDILIIGSDEKLTPTVFKSIDRPRIVASLSVDIKHIDEVFFHSSLVRVVYCETASIISNAEYVLGMMLLLEKRMIEANYFFLNQDGKQILESRPMDLYHKTLGVIGCNKVARMIMRMCSMFHMRILCYNIDLEYDTSLLFGSASLVDLDTLLKDADIITVHLPLLDSTRGFISKDKLQLLKKDASYIHISDLEIVDIDYLVQMASDNPLFHVGIDTSIKNSSLFHRILPNVFVTPGIASGSIDTIHRMDGEITNQILSIIQKEER